MSDPVAEKSGFLRMYMSNHPDTLVAYAKWFGKVEEPITGAQMTGITTKNITLACTLKDGSKKVVVVPIEPPLGGYDDVKPRLLEMKAIAQEGLGMIKAPRIDSFSIPLKLCFISGALVSAGCVLHLAPVNCPSSLLYPVNLARTYIGENPIAYNFWLVAAAHVLESLYTFSLCWKHSTGFFVGLQYVASTLLFGFPIWSSLRKRIQKARIDSVAKAEQRKRS